MLLWLFVNLITNSLSLIPKTSSEEFHLVTFDTHFYKSCFDLFFPTLYLFAVYLYTFLFIHTGAFRFTTEEIVTPGKKH